MNYQQHDEALWKTARRRAAFKRNLAIYFFMNLILTVTWYLTGGIGSYFWPAWPMVVWGAGLAFQYIAAYHNNSMFRIEDEYERLKHQQNNQI